MTKRQKRLLALAIVLLLILLMLLMYFGVYRRTKQLTFKFQPAANSTAINPPQFLFSFSGEGGERLQRPIGVLVTDGTVYVTDSVRKSVYTFTEDGDLKGSFGRGTIENPLYLAKNPKDGVIYVTDRRRYTIFKFTPDGRYVGEFKPNLPKSQQPGFETRGVMWQPVAIGFANDGTMFVTELLKGHRLLSFAPDGTFLKSTGDAGSVTDPSKGPEVFQFPNAIMVVGNQVYVADSNNQRVKVYTKDLVYERTIVTGGLPRGLAMLGKIPGTSKNAKRMFVNSDTLSHDAVIRTVTGEKMVSFGEQGVLDGQFSYPGAVAVGANNRIFVADTSNGRVQVWGWPVQAVGLSPKAVRNGAAALAALPFLLLPLLFLRKREYFATADFVEEMIARDEVDIMPHKRRRWTTTATDYEIIKNFDVGRVDLASLFEVVPYSESDVNALIRKYELDQPTAITLATAERAKVACIESHSVRRLAKVMELNVFNADEFIEKNRKA